MRIYIGLDDTDGKHSSMGTGRLARTLADRLSEAGTLWGVLRHQLPKMDQIPYTSNNSSACIVLDCDHAPDLEHMLGLAAQCVTDLSDPEGDPGLCLLSEEEVSEALVACALRTTGVCMRQSDAMDVAPRGRLLGLGGTNDGIIGATAAVGLTHYGWCGRFIEFGAMRSAPVPETIGDVQALGIRVVSTDRDPAVPLAEERLDDGSWIRPSLWAHCPVLQVVRSGSGAWKTAHAKRPKKHGDAPAAPGQHPGRMHAL